jgi:hypothetical protein
MGSRLRPLSLNILLEELDKLLSNLFDIDKNKALNFCEPLNLGDIHIVKVVS